MKNNSSSVFPSIVICICLVLLCATGFMGQTTEKPVAREIKAVASEFIENLNRPRLVSAEAAYLVTADGVVKNNGVSRRAETKNESFKNPTAAVQSLERQAFDILNRKRLENDLPALEWSDRLAEIARLHSENMARYKFFGHRGQDGSMVDARADSLGISKWQGIGENIAFNQGYDKPAEFACERWLLSVKHRENILHVRWTESGIGVAVAQNGAYYFTQVFIER